MTTFRTSSLTHTFSAAAHPSLSLTPGDTYTIDVKGLVDGSWSGWSSTGSIATADDVPPAPNVLQVRTSESTSRTLSFNVANPALNHGSTLTLSALLSEPADVEGGTLLVWSAGAPEYFDALKRGDGVVFHSERVHNVTAVMEGTRHSLVIELWEGRDNEHDRHS